MTTEHSSIWASAKNFFLRLPTTSHQPVGQFHLKKIAKYFQHIQDIIYRKDGSSTKLTIS